METRLCELNFLLLLLLLLFGDEARQRTEKTRDSRLASHASGVYNGFIWLYDEIWRWDLIMLVFRVFLVSGTIMACCIFNNLGSFVLLDIPLRCVPFLALKQRVWCRSHKSPHLIVQKKKIAAAKSTLRPWCRTNGLFIGDRIKRPRAQSHSKGSKD